ncbi:MAG: hypothetical protein DWQ34_10430 [Planctomycetota bacterium]|nr:MAG: hypothetical protein DWQ34_10430 [Planctomycetota bacterium]REK21452.1 MAG: hypothetical protein DWQ41_21720 [Planctomycetota bacterium]REK40036.1 MAG: hypothetical protein DWQ45_00325 [Planctomycetota bacterium]
MDKRRRIFSAAVFIALGVASIVLGVRGLMIYSKIPPLYSLSQFALLLALLSISIGISSLVQRK